MSFSLCPRLKRWDYSKNKDFPWEHSLKKLIEETQRNPGRLVVLKIHAKMYAKHIKAWPMSFSCII